MRTSYGLRFYHRKNSLTILFIALVTALTYVNIFGGEFVWDDHEFISENPAIRSLAHIPQAFFEPVVNLYRPLRTTLYICSYALFEAEPFGYHLTGLLLHFFCTLLVWVNLKRFFTSETPALLGALLFAVHPVHTESVAFMTASYDLLGPFFFLLSLYLFSFADWRRMLSWAAFAAALFSSEMTITLPALLLVLSLWIQKKSFRKTVLTLIPYVLLSAGYLFVRFVLLDIGARDTVYLGGSPLTTFFTMPRVGIEYLQLMFFPFKLIADYRHYPLVESVLSPRFYLPVVFLLAATVWLFLKRKQWPRTFFAWLWFWIALLPVSNLIPTGSVMAVRYLYLPSIALSFVLFDFFPKWTRKKGIALTLVLVLFSYITFMRNFDWKDEIVLWTKTSLQAPGSFVAHNNLGSHYLKKGLYNSSFEEITRALKLKPDFVDAYTNLGALYEKRKMFEEAQKAYEVAVALNPRSAAPLSNLGNIYLKQGKKAKAIESYKKSSEVNPYFYLAYYNLGNIEFNDGKWDEAEKLYRKTLSIQPHFVNALYNLSVLKAKQGQIKEAINHMEKVVTLIPKDFVAKQTLQNMRTALNAGGYPYASLPPAEKQ